MRQSSINATWFYLIVPLSMCVCVRVGVVFTGLRNSRVCPRRHPRAGKLGKREIPKSTSTQTHTNNWTKITNVWGVVCGTQNCHRGVKNIIFPLQLLVAWLLIGMDDGLILYSVCVDIWCAQVHSVHLLFTLWNTFRNNEHFKGRAEQMEYEFADQLEVH